MSTETITPRLKTRYREEIVPALREEFGHENVNQVARVVKVVGFVASDPSFGGQPGVINGASELLGEIFGDIGAHARSAVGVAALPLDAPVEIEFVFEFA